MQNPRLAYRYAKSLMDLALEQNIIEPVVQDMKLLQETTRNSAELSQLLRSPIVKADKKNAILQAIFGSRLNKLSQAFVKLLTDKGREGALPEIAASFIEQYKEMKRIRTAKLITAAPANDALRQAVKAKAEAALPGYTVELEEKVDPSIIGGFILEMGDRSVDASVRRDLGEVRKQFRDNLYISQVLAS